MRIDLDPPLDLGAGRRLLSCEDTFYRVEVSTPSGGTEVQAIPAAGEATPDNAAADLANPPPLILSAEEAEALLDAILDGWAREWGYTSAARCVTYVGDPDPMFAAEGAAMRDARSALWVAVRAESINPDRPPYTDANVRAFAAGYAPVRPVAP